MAAKKEEKQLSFLIGKRENVFRKLQFTLDSMNAAASDPIKTPIFVARYRQMESIYEEFKTLVDNINILTITLDETASPDFATLEAFEQIYFTIQASAAQYLPSTKPETCSESSNPVHSHVQPRLPKIDLPKFDSAKPVGSNWITFYDQFRHLIHDRADLSAAEKFHYLAAAISGPALNIVNSLPLSDTNYPIVWDALVSKYHHKRVLGCDLLDTIFNFSPLAVENVHNLNKFLNSFRETITSLNSLEIRNLSDFIIVYWALRCLPHETRKAFERQHLQDYIPSWAQLSKFVEDQVRVLEISQVKHPSRQMETRPSNRMSNPMRVHNSVSNNSVRSLVPYSSRALVSSQARVSTPEQYTIDMPFINKQVQCHYCRMAHFMYKCPEFLKLGHSARLQHVQDHKLCSNCMKGVHDLEQCLSRVNCNVCRLRHHTLLHPPSPYPPVKTSSSPPAFKASAPPASSSALHVVSDRHHSFPSDSMCVLLGTALVQVQDHRGAFRTVRALLDPGAQTSFITTACVQRLKLSPRRCNIPVMGLGQNRVSTTQGVITCLIKPRYSQEPTFTTDAVVLPTITSDLPTATLHHSVQTRFARLELADPHFDVSSPIDLLIAADLFPYIYTGEKILDHPAALKSIFGWVITGRIAPTTTSPYLTSLCATTDSMDDAALKIFWESEEPPKLSFPVNPDDVRCEQIFDTQLSRTSEGRYVVPLPFTSTPPTLPDGSYHLALSRLLSVERRLSRHPELRCAYSRFMTEYETLGHMSPVPVTHYRQLQSAYYIPHHAVFKDSNFEKIRVVFDGSAKVTNQSSLNDLLLVGPKLQQDIVDILCRFRLHAYVISADISKMYRQILVRPEDRDYQRILWRPSMGEPVQEFTLNTVTYGLTSSPYLALRTILQLTRDEGYRFPLAVQPLQQDVYVDDILTGASTLEETLLLKSQLIQLLHSGGFELRKWCSNSPRLIADIPEEHLGAPLSFDLESPAIVKVLGLQWDAKTDHFYYYFSPAETACTKRSILSYIARTWDPMGWLTPVTFRCKFLIQVLWRHGLGWDDPVPPAIASQWQTYCRSLSDISNLHIPRWILQPGFNSISLVGFCDASERGYAAVVYLVTEHSEHCKSHLLFAKSKVAPIKTLTIPRLELCGALLLSKLLTFALQSLSSRISPPNVLAFTDSTTVLSWLRTPTYQLKTYVASRVVTILEHTLPTSWHYVKSHLNPADPGCRGTDPAELVDHELWWSGPPWLRLPSSSWPTPYVNTLTSLPDLRNVTSINSFLQITNPPPIWPPLANSSSYTHVLRVTAWCLRFIHNCRTTKWRKSSPYLTCEELRASLTILVRNAQYEHFSEDVRLLSAGEEAVTSSLLRLRVHLDDLGLLRVGGRLNHVSVSDTNHHPVVLPSASPLSTLLVDHHHLKYFHLGPRALQSVLSRQFWILSVRKLIRSRISKCITCFKFTASPRTPLMGDLPVARVSQGRPFLSVGVDFGGPFLCKESPLKKARIHKCYLCLFICLSTKAVHLELVSDLSTNAFLAALDRFTSRRGLCSHIFSDCGTNLVGAHNELSSLYSSLRLAESQIADHLSKNHIEWHFQPPAAPHFNGISEAGIKSVKRHMKRVIGAQVLTFEEYATLLTKIEAILNSRPLCSLSPDPREIDVLTPGHFLTGAPLLSLPEHDLTELPLKYLDRWQLVKRSTQDFWLRWSRDYLHTLQQRSKWVTNPPNLKPGDLVLMMENNLPPQCWPMARVEATHPGKDGIVRVATIRTAHRKEPFERPVVKLCPLPVG